MLTDCFARQHHTADWTGILVLFAFVLCQWQVGTKVCYFNFYKFCVSRQLLGPIRFQLSLNIIYFNYV